MKFELPMLIILNVSVVGTIVRVTVNALQCGFLSELGPLLL